ncbi:DUF4194 domain-containing protein [Arthrobacter sp. NamB2]|uniref:DUF4194 domain-containing protein n=1 Tax=Arthrobacter sp. NamB2 TaxID=2576035 RepID=UPI0010C950A6|nr:DUF4194 domain-containing protein [Arthrobacter sp. NamB2]TKV28557.1 DUF4194 domain-containing protein [Arthrobacter sp. NamB2]
MTHPIDSDLPQEPGVPEEDPANLDLSPDEESDADSSGVLFEGDRGELTLAQRKALIVLLKRKYLAADKNPREWKTLVDSRATIEMRLNELFQVLVLDEERKFAYKRSAVSEDGETFPTLLHDRQYTLEETVLLVELRERYAREWSSGAAAVHVDREELLSLLATYRRADNTNHVDTRRREVKSIDGLIDEGILIKVESDAERLRVAPVINSVLTVEKLHALRQWVTNDMEDGTQA